MECCYLLLENIFPLGKELSELIYILLTTFRWFNPRHKMFTLVRPRIATLPETKPELTCPRLHGNRLREFWWEFFLLKISVFGSCPWHLNISVWMSCFFVPQNSLNSHNSYFRMLVGPWAFANGGGGQHLEFLDTTTPPHNPTQPNPDKIYHVLSFKAMQRNQFMVKWNRGKRKNGWVILMATKFIGNYPHDSPC